MFAKEKGRTLLGFGSSILRVKGGDRIHAKSSRTNKVSHKTELFHFDKLQLSFICFTHTVLHDRNVTLYISDLLSKIA